MITVENNKNGVIQFDVQTRKASVFY